MYKKSVRSNYMEIPPPAIFNPALAALQQSLQNLDQIEVSPQEVVRAADYLHCAVNYYDDESVN